MKEILKYLKPHTKRLVTVAFMYVLSAITSLLMPYVMSSIVDDGIQNGNSKIILVSSAVMIILALVSLTASIISNFINTKIATTFSSSVCKAMFKKINSLSFSQYSKIGSSGLLTRSTDDIFNIENWKQI